MEDVDIVLEVDGKKIPMNEFVRRMLSGVIAGSVSALHGVDEGWKVINISIKR
ncbi:MAG: hypothetical protein OIN66_09880 [Candidatus Methanoperedens sp.]|nr:hypothetical protein [Candidatus Methanoperedens sp.]